MRSWVTGPLLSGLAACVTAMASPAAAEPAYPRAEPSPLDRLPDPEVGPSDLHSPTSEQAQSVRPGTLRPSPQGGEASMQCIVTLEGRMRDCILASESPVGAGYGDWMLALAPFYTMRPGRNHGRPVESEVRLRMGWYANRRPPPQVPATWLREPTPEQLYAVLPANDAAIRGGGSVLLRCIVTVQGALRACLVDEEDPEGMGWGAAALALAPQLVMRPGTTGGQPVESETRIPIRWQGCVWCEANGSAVLGNVRWSAAPTYAQMQAVFPERARAAHVGGRVSVECAFERDGTVSHCSTVRVEPSGMGFGEAAMSLARHFRTEPPAALPGGRRFAGSHVVLTFNFPAEAAGPNAAPVLGRPRWTRLPSGEDALASYPSAALAAGVTGQVILLCVIGSDGGLSDCRVESETPTGQGFGASALGLAPQFRMTLWTEDGLPTVGSRVRFPLSYALPADTPPAAAAASP